MSGTFSGRLAYASIGFDGTTFFIANQSGDFSSVELVSGNILQVHLADAIDPSEAVYLAKMKASEGTVVVTRKETTDNRVVVVGFNRAGDPDPQRFDLVVLVKPLQ